MDGSVLHMHRAVKILFYALFICHKISTFAYDTVLANWFTVYRTPRKNIVRSIASEFDTNHSVMPTQHSGHYLMTGHSHNM